MKEHVLVSCDLGQGPVVGPLEHINEPSGSMNGSEFDEFVSCYERLRKARTLWSSTWCNACLTVQRRSHGLVM